MPDNVISKLDNEQEIKSSDHLIIGHYNQRRFFDILNDNRWNFQQNVEQRIKGIRDKTVDKTNCFRYTTYNGSIWIITIPGLRLNSSLKQNPLIKISGFC